MSGPLRHPQAFRDAAAVPGPDAGEIRCQIGDTVRSIRAMLDHGELPEPIGPAPQPEPQPEPQVGLLRAWRDWLGQRMRPPVPQALPPAPQPAPIIVQLPPEAPELEPVVLAVLQDAALGEQLQELVREELEGEMGQRFSANLRALVKKEIALAEERALIGR
ncbi:hypothetical protein [Paracoccus sp. PARArs4]|uniref:hypothetical protein n=1 Tax=Paracoccus sp. PARArs4 TaxID=2853442 RepID=UPI0024A78596|nr:hypothetical protein [Paracoccus sp. PARArs4]